LPASRDEEKVTEAYSHPALELLAEINPDQLSPREALEWIYRLKSSS